MAKPGIEQTARDEVDDMFDELLSQGNEGKEHVCELEDINPEEKGWEVVLHFGEVDPRVPGTQAHEDLKTFNYFIKLWIADFKYSEETNTGIFTHIEGCFEDQFAEEHLRLMKKYAPKATAVPEIRRIPGKENTVQASRNFTRDSADQLLAGVASAMTKKPPLIRRASSPSTPVIKVPSAPEAAPKTQRSPEEKRLEVPDDIVITLPLDGRDLEYILEETKCKTLEEVIQKFVEIVEQEELLIEHGEVDGTYLVNIYKDPGIQYNKPLAPENRAFIINFLTKKSL